MRYDRKAVAAARELDDPLSNPTVAALDAAVRSFPAVPTCVDLKSHEFLASQHLEQCLMEHFPRPQAPIKQPYLSKGSMALVKQQGQVLARFHTVGFQIKRAGLWFCLRFWKSCMPGKSMWTPKWRPARGPVTPQLCEKRNDLALQLALTDVQVKASVAVDYAGLLKRKSVELVEAALNGDQRAIAKLLKGIQPWVPQRDFRLCDDDGVPAQTYTGERRNVRGYFEA